MLTPTYTRQFEKDVRRILRRGKDPERIKRQFALNAKLTATIPIKSLSYPRHLSRLLEVVAAVLANLRRAGDKII